MFEKNSHIGNKKFLSRLCVTDRQCSRKEFLRAKRSCAPMGGQSIIKIAEKSSINMSLFREFCCVYTHIIFFTVECFKHHYAVIMSWLAVSTDPHSLRFCLIGRRFCSFLSANIGLRFVREGALAFSSHSNAMKPR